MKVLHCIHSLQGGGAERQLGLLADAAASQGIAVAIACIDDAGRERLAQAVTVFHVRRRSRIDRHLFTDTLTAIDAFAPDLVHAWLPAVSTVPAMLAARLRRIPVIFSYRMAMKHDAAFKPLEFVVAAACADGVISNSSPAGCTASFRWLYRWKRGVQIGNGVMPDPNPQGCMARLEHPGPIRLLFAGRLSPEKNWRCLLQAIARLPAERDIHLAIFGDGEDRSAVTAMIDDLALPRRVTLKPFDPDLRARLSSYDAFVMASHSEGMPNAVMEAMASGLPCILSDIPGHRAVCEPAAMAEYFDPHSPPSLAAAILSVAGNLQRRIEMSDLGIRRSEDFSVERMSARYTEAYQSVLASAARARIERSAPRRAAGR